MLKKFAEALDSFGVCDGAGGLGGSVIGDLDREDVGWVGDFKCFGAGARAAAAGANGNGEREAERGGAGLGLWSRRGIFHGL